MLLAVEIFEALALCSRIEEKAAETAAIPAPHPLTSQYSCAIVDSLLVGTAVGLEHLAR